MFTIRIKDASGHEWVKEATSVSFRPSDTDGESCWVTCFYADEAPEDIDEGDVYVMNENGKTVADYHLGRAPQA